MNDGGAGEERAARLASRLQPALLVLLALVLGALGQQRLDEIDLAAIQQRWGQVTGAVALYAAGALALWIARLQSRREPRPAVLPTETTRPAAGRRNGAWWISGTGALLALILLAVLAGTPDPAGAPPAPPRQLLGVWTLALALLVVPWLWPAHLRMPSRATLVARGPDLLLLVGLTVAAGWLRLRALDLYPAVINGDEASIGLEVRRVLAGDLTHPFITMWGAHGSLVAFILAGMSRLGTFSVATLRLFEGILGTLAVPALYLLGRQVGGRRIALTAALLLLTMPLHIHYSRVLMIVAWDTLSYPLTFGLLLLAMRPAEGRPALFALAGLVGGLGQYAYTGSRLLLVIVALFVLSLAVVDRARLRAQAAGWLLFALVALSAAGPFYLYGVQRPDRFNERINQVGIVQSGWLAAEQGIRGEGSAAILWDQFRRALFGFAFFPDRSEGWNPGTPLVVPLVALGLFFGLALTLRRLRSPPILLLHLWFWAAILSGGMLTVSPPNSNRLSIAAGAVALFAALGLDALARALAAARPAAERRTTAALLLVLLVAVAGWTQLQAHWTYAAANQFGGTTALIGSQVGRSLAASPAGTTLVMVGAPWIYSDVSPIQFLAPDRPALDLIEPVSGPPEGLPAGPLLFVVLPERAPELNAILAAYPDGVLAEVRMRSRPELLYYEVRVPERR